ncbi:MAG: hypothetical protein DMF98_17480 [Acidobacteria bacterium]|nr:MAG: hypothetical protein DMF98_17480 [Acidobacteriota bacterium]
MRGDDRQPEAMFSYVSMETRIPADHPLRAMRVLVDAVLRGMLPRFRLLYARTGRRGSDWLGRRVGRSQ